MERLENDSSICEYLMRHVRRYISSFDCKVFLIALACIFLTHMYAYTNKLINHDEIDALYDTGVSGLALGRWLIRPFTQLLRSFSSSWLRGVLGAGFLAASVTLMMKLFRVRNLLAAALIGIVIATFPAAASINTYVFVAAMHYASMLFAVMGVCFCVYNRNVFGILAGSTLFACSLALYQAYFPFAAVLFVSLLILDICEQQYGPDWKTYLLQGIRYVISLGLGMALYFIVLRVMLSATGTELTSYQGISQMGKTDIPTLIGRIFTAYSDYYDFFDFYGHGIYHPLFRYTSKACMLFGIGAVVFSVFHRKLYRHKLLTALLAAVAVVFPLASSLITVMTDGRWIHHLMVYPLVITLIVPGLILDRLKLSGGRVRRCAALLCAAAAICLEIHFGFEGALVTNRAYFVMDIHFKNAYAYLNRVATRIEMDPSYSSDSVIAMIGHTDLPDYAPRTKLTGVYTAEEIVNETDTREAFLERIMGCQYHFADGSASGDIEDTQQFKDMPCYPEEGSIQEINGVLTVKFSDVDDDEM